MRKYRLTDSEQDTLMLAVEFAFHTLNGIDANVGLSDEGQRHLETMRSWHGFLSGVRRVTVQIDDDAVMTDEEQDMADFLRSLAGIQVIGMPPLHTPS